MNVIQVSACLIIIAILVNFVRKLKNKRFYKLLEPFPSYPTYPLIGNAHLLLGSYEGFMGKLEKITDPYDRMVYWLGPMPILFLKKHDDIATILNQSNDRDTLEIVAKWAGIGILTARYEEWRKSRKLLAPGFTTHMLSKYAQVFNKTGLKLVEKLKPAADTGEQIDILDSLLDASLDATLENAMGITNRNSKNPGENFCSALHEGLKHIIARVQWPFLFSDYLNEMYLKLTGKINAIDHLQYLPNEILSDKLKDNDDCQQQSKSSSGDEGTVITVASSKTIIDLLVKSNLKEDGFTEKRIRDELLQILIAGVETTALSMSFLMLMLATNQDVQQKVYQEITKFLTDNKTLSEIHSTDQLEYLEQCIKETLRMFSPLVATFRRMHKEISLKDNIIVPKNMFVVAFLHFASYDPDLYKNPNKWDPEHFSKEAVKQRPKTSQLAFGYGPRSCLGAKYAMMSIKTQIAYILFNYHLSTDMKEITTQDLTIDLCTRSKKGYPIKLTSRQKIKL